MALQAPSKLVYASLLRSRKRPKITDEEHEIWFRAFAAVRRKKFYKLCISQNWKCFYCDKEVAKDAPRGRGKNGPTIEHLIRQCEGGTDHMFNLVMACGDCNTKRGDLPAYQFFQLLRSGWFNYVIQFDKNKKKEARRPYDEMRRARFIETLAEQTRLNKVVYNGTQLI